MAISRQKRREYVLTGILVMGGAPLIGPRIGLRYLVNPAFVEQYGTLLYWMSFLIALATAAYMYKISTSEKHRAGALVFFPFLFFLFIIIFSSFLPMTWTALAGS